MKFAGTVARMFGTIVENYTNHDPHKCGYCKSTDTSYTHGMWAQVLTTQDYQDLIDRGWRRCGCYCYQPLMKITCCPQYPIRCDITQFQLSKSQKKVLKKFNNYLRYGRDDNRDGQCSDHGDSDDGSSDQCIRERASKIRSGADRYLIQGKIKISPSKDCGDTSRDFGSCETFEPKPKQEKHETPSAALPKPGLGPDPNKSPCKKAKFLRLERKKQKLLARGLDPQTILNKPCDGNKRKTVSDFVNESLGNEPAHKLKIKLVQSQPPSEEFTDTFNEEYKLYHLYQTTIHKEKPEKCTQSGFQNFLVESPLISEVKSGVTLGSFHQQYWIDDKLVAVAVLDILPTSVSAKYFFYNPEYRFLSLGTYSALREIKLVQDLNALCPDIKDYCMGFYIHSCPKMRYKAQYYPSYLLCPETYTWHPVQMCKPLLDKNKYARFAPEDVVDVNGAVNLKELNILCRIHDKFEVLSYSLYRRVSVADDEKEIEEFMARVGSACSKRMFLYRRIR